MRRALLVAVLCCASGCAARATSAKTTPPTPPRYVFGEELEAFTRVCVPRHPFSSDLNCMPLAELRQWLRQRRYVSFAPAPPVDDVEVER